jgi:hypothetical protein
MIILSSSGFNCCCNKCVNDVVCAETCEPYWTTNYHFKDRQGGVVAPPIFHCDLRFERWLGLWCRYLSLKVQLVYIYYDALFRALGFFDVSAPH